MSATEILIEALEDFGTAEPKGVLVIWTNSDGDVVIKSSGLERTHMIGLAEYAKQAALRLLFSSE